MPERVPSISVFAAANSRSAEAYQCPSSGAYACVPKSPQHVKMIVDWLVTGGPTCIQLGALPEWVLC